MITKIYKSIYAKPTAIVLAISIFLMSFKMIGNDGVTLNAGTPVALQTASTISSEMVTIGKIVDFKVMTDVKVGDKTVISAGSIAKGQVVRASHAKGLGKEGYIEIQIKSVTAVDGQEVYLNGGNLFQEGQDRETLAIVLGVVVCILFLTLRGKDAVIPAGYQVTSVGVASTMTIKV